METLSNLQKMSRYDSTPKFMGGTEMNREFVWHKQERPE